MAKQSNDREVKVLSKSALHEIPSSISSMLLANKDACSQWESITPIARNEWICWVTSAKKQETQDKRLRIMKDNLSDGKKRPCCWPGCPHRNPKTAKWFK